MPARSIVLHPWFGSTDRFVATPHYAATTWGCPAVSDELPREFGMAFWACSPDGDWSARSKYQR